MKSEYGTCRQRVNRYTIVYKTMQNRKGGRRMEEMQNQELSGGG